VATVYQKSFPERDSWTFSALSLRPLRLCGRSVCKELFTAEAQRTQR